ncbi:restriction endonuclease subunit S [Alkalihalobacillus sp. R86527]|uniref:restriction endonuclease subunit S n=1 Tax=Alkalihalobacillus sp. R86527 TaxID=3093863 RepID=UPI00366FC286
MSKKKSLEKLMEEALISVDEMPYQLPGNWTWSKLGKLLTEIQYGYTEKSTFEQIGPHFLRITDLNEGINWDNVPYCNINDKDLEKYRLKNNDVVVARMGSVGKSQIIKNPESSVFASYLIRLKVNKSLDADYLSIFMKSPLYWNQITSNSKGTTRANINTKGLKNLNVPLPPLNEQKSIVKKVERLFLKIEEAKQLIEEAKETLELRRTAILDKAFNGGFTQKKPSSNNREWKHINLEEACELISDCPHSTPKYNEDGEYLAIRSSDIYFGIVNTSDAKRVTEEEYCKRIKRVEPQKEDIIYCREGSGDIGKAVGKAGLLMDDGVCLAQRVVLLRPNKKVILPKYFSYVLNSPLVLKQVASNISQTTSPRINMSTLKQLNIPLAPIKEQQKIVGIIEKNLDIEEKANVYHTINENLDLLMQSILSKAFRGELGTNEPEEESAIELLKEVFEEQVK